MKRRLGYLGLWLVATVLAVGMAWLGLRSVLVAAAPGRLDLLDHLGSGTARAVGSGDAVALAPPTSAPGATGPLGPLVPISRSGIPIHSPGPGSQGPGPGPGGDPTATTTPPGVRPTENGTRPTSTRPTVGGGTTTTPQQSDPSLLGQPEPQTRTVRTKGGDSMLRFAADNVAVVTARPVSGHAVKVERTSATSVVVTFSSANSFSRIQANWSDGPAWRITEYQYQ